MKWFKSYLADRSNYDIFNGVKFENTDVECVALQCLILGPLFFIISVNAIYKVSYMYIMFAIKSAHDTCCIVINGTDLIN